MLLGAFLLVPFEAFAQVPPRADAYVLTDSVKIGERFTISLAAEHAVDSEVVFPTPDPESRLFGDLRVIRRGPVHERGGARGRRVDSVAYEVTTFALDSARVPPLSLRVVAGSDTTRVNTSARMVPVTSVVDEEAQGLRDPAALASFPRPLWAWLVLGLVVTALLAGLVYVWWRHHHRNADQETVSRTAEVEKRSPYEEATVVLRRLGQRDLTDSEAVKRFYVDLTDVLRTYLSRQLGIATFERTTRELIYTLEHRPDVSTEAVERIQSVLELADLVKFAGTRTSPADNQEALQEARAAIEAIRRTPRSSAHTRAEEAPSPA